jgi:hypothetical protein
LLAEEIEASPDFAAWFARQVLGSKSPAGTPLRCNATISFHRVLGETDIRIEMEWGHRISAVFHVEDKLDAQPQPEQADRYKTAIIAESAPLSRCVLFAPNAWILRHPKEVKVYDAVVSQEAVADWLRDRAKSIKTGADSQLQELVERLRWRAKLLDGHLQSQAVRNAIEAGDLTDWNAAAAEVISARTGLSLQVAPRQRTLGTPKESRFIIFDEELSPGPDGARVTLKLKTRNKNHPGRVSLEVNGAAGDRYIREAGERAGFRVEDSERGRSLMITVRGSKLDDLQIADPVKYQVEALEQAADLAQELIVWWEGMSKQHTGSVRSR